jgi:3-hydroxybutyryl-CoA dehydrogenase
MRLVEVVVGDATDPAVVDGLIALMGRWGKVAIRAASTPGFVVNRVARPFYGEALRLLDEQAASPGTIDAALRDGCGFRMGPLELTDLIGQDVNAAVNRSVWTALGHDPRYTPSVVQDALVDAGRLGRKTGQGFYPDGGTPGTPDSEPPVTAVGPARLQVDDDQALRPLADRLRAAGVDVTTDGAAAGTPLLAATDGRTATARSAAVDRDVLLIDHCEDWAAATLAVVAAPDGCASDAVATVVAALQAAGLAVSRVDDVPGLVAARTLAALVNAGVDAVARGVASASDVDLAMRHGANHPRGPLEWGDRLGLARVLTLLDHLEDTYRDGRYRASPLLRRHVASGRPLRGDARTEPSTDRTPEPAHAAVSSTHVSSTPHSGAAEPTGALA